MQNYACILRAHVLLVKQRMIYTEECSIIYKEENKAALLMYIIRSKIEIMLETCTNNLQQMEEYL